MPHMFFCLEISRRKLRECLLSRTRTNVSNAPHPNSSTFSPLLYAALLQYVAIHGVAYIVVLTAHQKLSIGVTVRLMIV